MAAKADKLNATEATAGIVAVVFVLNWLSAKYWHYPFGWCWGKWLLQPVLEPCAFVAHFMALGYFILRAMTLEAFKVVQGLMVVAIVFLIPTITETLLRLGKSCG